MEVNDFKKLMHAALRKINSVRVEAVSMILLTMASVPHILPARRRCPVNVC